MKIMKFTPGKGKAQAMVEFAIVLPILLLVVYGLIETGRFIFTYAFVSNATRQAVRYGSTSGVGANGVPRYQDCAGIRAEAQRVDFLNAFDDASIAITYDNPDAGSVSFDGVCNGNTDINVNAVTGDRVIVTINSNFIPLLPKFLPFLARTVAKGNPITVESSRTLLLKLDIAPPKELTTTEILSDNPDPSQVGDYVTVTVRVTSNSGATTPTGKVFITGAEENCTITLSGGTGSCTVRFLTAAVSPPKVIVAQYEGDTVHDISSDTENHTVNFAPAVVTITSDTPDPSLVTDTVTVSFKVTGAFGTPTGTVTITGQSSGCATVTLDVNGLGSCTVNFASTGKKTLTASYSGDTVYAPSTKNERHDVILPTETVTIIQAHSPDPSEIGQSVTVFVSVGGITPPSGTVTITGANTDCSFTLPATSCVVTFTSIGNKTLTATFASSNPLQTGSSDSVSHTVQLPATTTTITAHTPSPSVAGEPVTVTVTVTGGSTTPTGTVAITGADTNCNITLAGGTGSCNVVFSSSGSKTLTAAYGGDGLHAASNTTATHVVSEPPIANCDQVTAGLLQQTNGALTMTINNPLTVPLQISKVSVRWNHDQGHQTGSDKTLRLEFANLNGTVFFNGNELGDSYEITPNQAIYVQPNSVGPTTITFTFQQSFDRWDSTEYVQIQFTNLGCKPLYQNQH